MTPPKKKMNTTADFNQMIRIIFWNSFGFMFYQFLIPYATSEYFQVNTTTIGLIVAAQPIGRLLTTPLVGILTDRVSKKLLVMIGSLGRTVSYTILYLSVCFDSIIGFGIGIFVQGLLVGFFWPPFNSLVAEKSSRFYRSEAYGKRYGVMGLGSLAGATISFSLFVGGKLWLDSNVWIQYSSLIVYALINMIAGIQFMKKVDEKLVFIGDVAPNQETPNKEQQTTPKSNKNLIILGFIILSLTVLFSSINERITRPFFQVYMYANFAFSDISVMIVIYLVAVVGLMASPLVGKFADKVGVIGFVIVAAIGAIVTAIIISTSLSWLFITLLFVDVILALGGQLIAQSLFSRISKSHRGRIFALMEWMNLSGWVVGPILGGWLWDTINPKTPFIMSIILELLTIPLFMLALKYLRNQMDEKVKK